MVVIGKVHGAIGSGGYNVEFGIKNIDSMDNTVESGKCE